MILGAESLRAEEIRHPFSGKLIQCPDYTVSVLGLQANTEPVPNQISGPQLLP